MVAPLDPGDRAKLERRRQILSAAKAVFAEAGYHGASIHAIIERAQIARGTFYLYFESKAAVFDSILDEAMTDLRARIHRIEVADKAAPPPQVQPVPSGSSISRRPRAAGRGSGTAGPPPARASRQR